MTWFFFVFLLCPPLFSQEPLGYIPSEEALPVTILIQEDYPWTVQDSFLVEEAFLEVQRWFYDQSAGWTILLEEPITRLRRISSFPEVSENLFSLDEKPDSLPMAQMNGRDELEGTKTSTQLNNSTIMNSPEQTGTMPKTEDWTWWYRVREAFYQENLTSPRRLQLVLSSLPDPLLGGEQEGLVILSREVLDGLTNREAPKGRDYYLGVLAHEILHASGADHPDAVDGSLISMGFHYFPYSYLNRDSMANFLGSAFVSKSRPVLGPVLPDEELFLSPYYGIRKRRGTWEIWDLTNFRWITADSSVENSLGVLLTLGEKSFVFYKDSMDLWIQELGPPRLLAGLHPHPWVQFEDESEKTKAQK
jgi:hypothetical protein